MLCVCDDYQQIEASDVGPLLKIRVGHDGKGSFAGWFLDKVFFVSLRILLVHLYLV